MENKDKLSWNRFKDRDVTQLSPEETHDYIFATLLKEAIEILEVSVANERVFKRARYSMMTTIWNAYEKTKGQ